MADWDHDDYSRSAYSDRERRDEGPGRDARRDAPRDWRPERDWRAGPGPGPRPERPVFEAEPRHAGPGAGRPDRYGRDSYEGRQRPDSARTAGGAAQGYGDGGDTAYGQLASGSSASGLGGYSGADVGGWGQPNLNSQWGQGGFGPLSQGIDYGQGGGRFGPAGYDTGAFGAAPRSNPRHHDEHHAHYSRWRDTQLSNHDRDYSRWRDEQARRYDEDYGAWRNERHTAFSQEFEGWRTGRGGQAAPTPTGSAPAGAAATDATVNPSERSVYGASASASATADGGAAHGANPVLARLADGETVHHHHAHHDDKAKDDASR